ncbi:MULTISPECIES: OmpA family protein [unclassified Mesorhizobium]|uniref:OmpA family protein n=1 Tax=unclassified Mesorhizobium TaxID=325217 RepID=UPI000FD786E4|nr:MULTISPECIES: OmpA family protein [unclassified Mesorhizobium]TGQ16373.1 OmpA family protein [Mesorhizobium sp. M2E.F.Ca.ET.219.01.1.1]TGT77530.1 OmpA family protein [Mesorhizobium sp. M2E.F.Ca.ET.166.01.1.1]TGW03639.1 OmpA family protein [Mesorhizobium sp. M2E.F.Ca.ET.154.01.1.1]
MRTPIAAALMALFYAATACPAQTLSSEEIRCRLDPTCPKPGYRALPFGKRGVLVDPTVVSDKPNAVNLYVTFAYDSADLLNDSIITLDALGKALTDPSLTSSRFLIAGHTDARGTDEYNQKLSVRRAEAVANYLISNFSISASRLDVKGYGKTELYDPNRPDDQVNRRVQVVNLSADDTHK